MKNRLRVLRAERGPDPPGSSRAVGVSRQAIIALESDKHDPSLDLAYRLAAIFGQPVESIFENPHGE